MKVCCEQFKVWVRMYKILFKLCDLHLIKREEEKMKEYIEHMYACM